MKREIKFRAFHLKERKMCKVEVLTNEGCFLVGVEKGENQITDDGEQVVLAPTEGCFCKNGEFELMQFTGLKDKNGKEIYESDILKLVFESIKMVGFVKYQNDGEWDLYKDDANFVGVYHNRERIAIIGNIHENPELLK